MLEAREGDSWVKSRSSDLEISFVVFPLFIVDSYEVLVVQLVVRQHLQGPGFGKGVHLVLVVDVGALNF